MAEARRRRREHWAGLVAVLVAIALGSFGIWPVPEAVAEDRVLETILDDRVVIGIVRLTVVVTALYAIANVPALVVGGRWAKGVGTGRFVADDAHVQVPAFVAEIQRQLAALRLDNRRLMSDRDELLSLIDAETKPA